LNGHFLILIGVLVLPTYIFIIIQINNAEIFTVVVGAVEACEVFSSDKAVSPGYKCPVPLGPSHWL